MEPSNKQETSFLELSVRGNFKNKTLKRSGSEIPPTLRVVEGEAVWIFVFVLTVFGDEGDVAPLSQEGITSARTSMA